MARYDDHEVARTVWLRARRYRHPGFGAQFTRQVLHPPTYEAEGPDGRRLLLRRTGSGIFYPFWYGFDGVGRPLPAATPGGVAYSAGRFRRVLERAGRLPELGALKVDPVTGRLAKGQVLPPPDAEGGPGPRP